ncbi:MAG: hypothetical protein ABI130_15310 [Leifsonia sp.]
MLKKTLLTAVVSLAGAATCIAVTTPAFADTATPTPTATAPTAAKTAKPAKTLAQLQSEGATATTKRIASLTAAISKVNADKFLTSGDKSTILNTFTGDVSGLKNLAGQIAATTTTADAKADLVKIDSQYRVYSVAIPQARIAALADRLSGSETSALTAAQKRLSALLNGKDKAKSTDALQSDLTDIGHQLDAIASATKGLATNALGVTPTAYNGNHAALQADKAAAKSAQSAAKKAHADVKTIVTALKKK